MGNSVSDPVGMGNDAAPRIEKFYSQSSWIDHQAEDQLSALAQLDGVRHIAGFPDLHIGKYGPVGCAVLADRVHPHLIGNDIGCGMALFELDINARKLRLDKAERRLRGLAKPTPFAPRARLDDVGIDPDLWPDALGTLGGGNHFCELQSLHHADPRSGLDQTRMYLLIHSGSRGLGNAILEDATQNRSDTKDYLRSHDIALTWARLNRQMIAEHAAQLLGADLRLIMDAPHNFVEEHANGFLHRKGSASTAAGLIPLAGSRASPSYVMQSLGENEGALNSMSHGAGRKYDRRSMHGRIGRKKSELGKLTRTALGGRVICDDKALLVEEAPLAYKSAAHVAQDLENANIAERVATLHPFITYKKAQGGRS